MTRVPGWKTNFSAVCSVVNCSGLFSLLGTETVNKFCKTDSKVVLVGMYFHLRCESFVLFSYA